MRKIYLIIALLAVSGLAGGWLYTKWISGPEYSLLQVKAAYDRNDVALFERHTDIDSMVERAIDAMSDSGLEVVSNAYDSKSVIVRPLLGDFLAMMKPKTIDYAREEIRNEVERRSGPKPIRAQLFGSGTTKINKAYVREEGEAAYIGIENHAMELQSEMPLEFKLLDMGGYWKVVELSNLKAMIAQTVESRKARPPGTYKPVEQMFANLGSTSAWFYSEWTKSPEYSLLQLEAAIDTKNVVLFERHCDVDSLVTRVVDVGIELAVSEQIKQSDEDDILGTAMALVFVDLMKPTLIEYARKLLLSRVEGTAPASLEENGSKSGPKGSINGLFSNSPSGVRQVSLQRDGQAAFFDIETYDEKQQVAKTWQFRLRDMGGYWQVIEISNLREVMESN